MKMNSGSVLAKISTIQQIPYRIFNVKSLFLIIINLIFNFNTILTLNSSMINLISVIFFSFDDSFTSQNILKE
ncbi:Uncharacterised protein [Chryseobacterium gleum]|uniref:Uncharacterized protein n=2 Tax=Chryseobacterium gleum TaxID=250 RepID=A0A3S4QUY2_CHRGE|nr:hypothetical protein HMPREF0204_13290 [Chryseobacterium gleum ATCC 35910]VEE05600.1 Uncharacterised protein [Chryseobacterium gleum]